MYETFSDYLLNYVSAGVIDFNLRAKINQDGNAQFYIHPSGRDGQTRDFEITPEDFVRDAAPDGLVKS